MQYVIALGSNQRHPLHGAPPRVLAAALVALGRAGITVLASSSIRTTPPLGPALRRYANGAALIETRLEPEDLLVQLQQIETAFGRRRLGQRWRARVLDLDIVLAQRGAWCLPGLTIPHPAFRQRRFVTAPVQEVAADWRDPISNFTIRQVHARLTRPRPLPR